MADLLLSPVLDVIVDNLATPVLEKFGNLWGLKDNVQKLRRNLRMVQAVLEDAEEQQASNGAVRIWLSKLKEVAYEAESLLLLLSADNSLLNSIKYGDKVKETIHALEMAADEGLRFNLKEGSIVHREWDRRPETSSFVLEHKVFGREKDKEEIVKLLLSCERSRGGEASCIPIVGMGGLGKTTLAQLAYNDHEVKRHFDVQVWVFVSDQFDVKNIMRTVIESLSKDKCHYPTLDALYLEVCSLLQCKRYLIVLDDVWSENPDDWDKLRPLLTAGIDGSKILITTRSKKVADLMTNHPDYLYCLKELSRDACWSLFLQRAFPLGDEEKHPTLLPLGEQIITKSVVRDFRSSAIPDEIYEAEHHLRTLLLFSGGNLEVVPKKLFSSLKCLFVLDLGGSGLTNLDGLVGALSHLKYLDLSHTDIRKLPPEIERLHNLETLNLFHCYNLIQLPDLEKMNSLRHLNNDGCRSLTRMLNEKVMHSVSWNCGSQLRTLPLFVIGDGNDCMFLKKIQLRGSLKVTQLENATNALKGISGVESLGLYWRTDEGCPIINQEVENVGFQFQVKKGTLLSSTSQRGRAIYPLRAETLLDSFKPADSLQRLLIKDYPGYRFPNLIARGLRELDLISCQNCQNLPSLENVPNLTRLLLREIHRVTYIDRHFGQLLALKELVLMDFPMLETWSSTGSGRLVFPTFSRLVFPSLRKLVLNNCPKLTVMPQILTIQHLNLRDCPAILVHSFQNLTYLETLVIQGVRDLLHFPAMFPSNNPLLTTLEIKSCSRLRSLPGELGNLSALKSLTIQWCENLFSLPQSLQNLSALESLEIGDCHSLTSLPQGWTRGLGNLRSLSIENCSKLSYLSMECEHLISLKTLTIMYCPTICTLPEGVEHLSALQRLSILDLPELIYLPEGLQNLSLLHSLEIGSCRSLKHLPGWIDKLVSLRSLTISDCQDLGSLPEGLTCLTALQYLAIHDCPRLLERCKQERGEDWPKIAHVPHKNIGLPKLKRPREEGSSSTN
ncbi:hypothetical protein TIFTF001_047713 [Ficus carica]|uniref:Uncharacterized protein n=1 Tax=Ficus carica TaxID=3494 RepID=A0AA87YZ36_FICCA|nr:hypothetical protein TIFTF001_047710 [Ficus carica]GMN25230.1 hypothetical protein TIFTF001_047711 [Ficus carica]GMN25246.1 hypothetical protein TIFTF001_047712 [Ficus carica]GMN25262.1 hypothetical protein TIFTF001_047713 [Ficus carica]